MSKGEDKIRRLLDEAGAVYVQEKTFKDLKQGLFRFDFYVLNVAGAPAIVEYNGEQHYFSNPRFFKNRYEFLHQQNNDRRKISYCLANNIPIYCIPFWELDKIEKATDLFQTKFRANDRWKNDEDWRLHNKK